MNVDMRLSEINRFADEVRRLIAASDSAVLRAPSALPDWTRAHVVAHIIGVSHALARQLEYALRDETVEVYDGGQAGRNAEIERVAALSPELLHSRVDTALARLTAAIDAVRLRGDWAAPIVYRDGVAADGLDAAWRELAVHVCDLDLDVTNARWSPEFARHLFEFLVECVPEDTVIVLGSQDGDLSVGTGSRVVRATATPQDFAAWLAGRRPSGPVHFDPDEPVLKPWPPRR